MRRRFIFLKLCEYRTPPSRFLLVLWGNAECEEFLIKCPFACFAQVCPRKKLVVQGGGSRILAGIQRVPEAPQGGANVSECVGWMQRTIPGFRLDAAPFLSIPQRSCLGCTSFRKQQLRHHVTVLSLSSALGHANGFCNCRSTLFSPFLGDFFFLSGGLLSPEVRRCWRWTQHPFCSKSIPDNLKQYRAKCSLGVSFWGFIPLPSPSPGPGAAAGVGEGVCECMWETERTVQLMHFLRKV